MTTFDDHFDSARRHFGVALIDLNYAAADLARSVACSDMQGGAVAAFDILSREIDRLKQLSTLIDEIAEFRPSDDSEPTQLQRWWPNLVRSPASQEESAPD